MAQIRVNDANDLCRRGAESFDHSGAETELAGAMDDADWPLECQAVGDLTGAVRRVVVDDHQFARDAGAVVGGKDRAHELGQPVAFVIGGDHEGERGRCRYARWQGMGSAAL